MIIYPSIDFNGIITTRGAWEIFNLMETPSEN